MPSLYKFAFRSFLPILIAAFFVVWFVFVMQHLWLYIDDFIGKGLDSGTILKTLWYQSVALIPIALPLGILFASMMCFGNIGESSELVALKSAGISVFHFAKPLLYFVVILSIGLFFFNDILVPKSQIKAITIYSDIVNKKPAVSIKAGEFYRDIPNQTIYIGSKSADNVTIHDVLIIDRSENSENPKVITAKKGKMFVTEDKAFLIFELFNGWRFEEKIDIHDRKNEQIRLSYAYWKKIFDLSDFKMKKSDEDYFKNLRSVMSLKQINKEIDSNAKKIRKSGEGITDLMQIYIPVKDSTIEKNKIEPLKIKSKISKDDYTAVMSLAESNARAIKNTIDINVQNLKILKQNYAESKVEFHRRLTIPFACIVLFLIGISIGAIVRKGGYGMPFILAACFFVLYYVLNNVGEKMAREMLVPTWLGMWLSSLLYSILSIFLLYKANTDSPLFVFRFLNKNK